MNLQTFLLISKDSGLRQLVEAAVPHTQRSTQQTAFQKDSRSGLKFPQLWFSVKAVPTPWLPFWSMPAKHRKLRHCLLSGKAIPSKTRSRSCAPVPSIT